MSSSILFLSLWFSGAVDAAQQLKFYQQGHFKILQVADMHYGDGKSTLCEDVFPDQMASRSDLNTNASVNRMITAENPDRIVYTVAIIDSNIPWAAVLGNHDQESTLSREDVMKHIAEMKNMLSRVNPSKGHTNKSVLNLYLLDSGDYSTVPSIPGYGWIKESQQKWFMRTSKKLKKA